MVIPTLALLAVTVQQPQDFAIELYVSQPIRPVVNTVFRPGEIVRLWVETTEDAYVTVLDVTPDSRIRLVYPYSVDRAIPRFRAGEIHPLSIDPVLLHWVAPNPRAGGWGPGYLVAIASRNPIQLRPRLEGMGLLARFGGRYFSVLTGFASQHAILDLLDGAFAGDEFTAVVVPYDVVAPIVHVAAFTPFRCPTAIVAGLSHANVYDHEFDCLPNLRRAERREPLTDRPREDTTTVGPEDIEDRRRKDTVAVDRRERLRPDVERERLVEDVRDWNPGVAERMRVAIRPVKPPQEQDPIETIRRFRPEIAERLTERLRADEYERRRAMEELEAAAERRNARWARLAGWSAFGSTGLSSDRSWTNDRLVGGTDGGGRWSAPTGGSPVGPTPVTPAQPPPSPQPQPRPQPRERRPE